MVGRKSIKMQKKIIKIKRKKRLLTGERKEDGGQGNSNK